MMERKEFRYNVKIEKEILANREQEYIRNKGREYESEFEECDFQTLKDG